MTPHSPEQVQTLLAHALERFKKTELAAALGVDTRTIARWATGENAPKPFVGAALESLLTPSSVQFHENPDFTFIDAFAGIGGIRQGFEEHGGECVFTSEWNAFSKKTYTVNFGDGHEFIGDIVGQQGIVPAHDVLLGGFPCQPFSIAGVSKKNSLGRPHGFDDPTQGTLFFELKEIIKTTRPAAFVLENVKNLKSHDRGNTFAVIMSVLRDELGYDVYEKVIDGGHFTPQHRERIIIVGFARKTEFTWDDLILPEKTSHKLGDILHRTDGTEPVLPHDGDKYFNHAGTKVNDKFTLTENLWTYLQNYAAKHKAAGNGFGFGLVNSEGRTRTLSARYHKDGSEILVEQPGQRPRRLTPRECARLMGFDDSFVIPVSDTQAYRQFGNSVVVPVFKEVARIMKPHLMQVMAVLDAEQADLEAAGAHEDSATTAAAAAA
ncbi:DNA (cytosine-5-)-methyltransferase [Cryobacterium sp. TMT2-23]|uniref:DNA (cytosine-5-)-methyltransferase n=1 Tax=Cryobacterium sp. TMT2-23 TaxID=1259252 RepID=UPI00106CEF7F|nr:DNA (cytosine-5-)-methyltransferase [Cryobacterium sp. TMT2-23]TFD23801.1 DNA (cytosine-5-)-methyltransferase [Cryobacterium sp. TMT2-23]